LAVGIWQRGPALSYDAPMPTGEPEGREVPTVTVDRHLPFLQPWLRVSLLIRICSTTWDSATWPTMKEALRNALRMQAQMRRPAWWN
jgi:hypothetical protein